MKENEMNKERKSNHQEYQVSMRNEEEVDEDDNDRLALSLSYGSKRTKVRSEEPLPPPALPHEQEQLLPLVQEQEQPQQMVSSMQTLISQPLLQIPLQLSASHPIYNVPSPLVYQFHQEPVSSSSSSVVSGSTVTGPSRPVRVRRNPTQAPREGKSDTVRPPYPWATNRRATVHSVNYLLSKEITKISGDVQCKRCERQYKIDYDLKEKFTEIGTFIAENKSAMHHRAPPVWKNPVLPKCQFCDQENSAEPVIARKKKEINWLFLLLGQMLGCCTLKQLKYFCKHTKNHRTGAKDRVLYLTYLGLCMQLDPAGPFNR
ncbi:hypothetical protein DITRI_Ditri01bG0080300 [Diplodiscus trichospermus]